MGMMGSIPMCLVRLVARYHMPHVSPTRHVGTLLRVPRYPYSPPHLISHCAPSHAFLGFDANNYRLFYAKQWYIFISTMEYLFEKRLTRCPSMLRWHYIQ